VFILDRIRQPIPRILSDISHCPAINRYIIPNILSLSEVGDAVGRLPKLNRRGVPESVLTGKSYKYRSVHTLYKAVLLKEIMRRVNISFWARAKRGSDDLGNKWKPLAPSTHAYKPLSPIEKKTYKIGNKLTRGLLTPAQDRIWRTIYARTLQRLEKKGESNAEKKAAERAWAVVKNRGARTKLGLGRITDTNIRTGALVASTKDGAVANNRYYAPKNQRVTLGPRSINIKLVLPYAEDVDKVRPIIPDDISKWILEAHEIAIVEAKQLYDRIQNTTPDRVRRNKNKPTSRGKERRS